MTTSKRLPLGSCTACGTPISADAIECAACGAAVLVRGQDQRTVEKGLSLGDAVLRAVGRLFVGAVVWFVLMMLALLSGIPYGGGSRSLFGLAQLATIFIPVWALWPVGKFVYLSIAEKASRK